MIQIEKMVRFEFGGDSFKYAHVEMHSYRTATVREVFLVLPRELMRSLEEGLAQAAGKRADNHTVYAVTRCAGHPQLEQKLYFWFSDFDLRIGREIELGRH